MDAAAWWAGGGKRHERPKAHVSAEVADDMHAFGLEEEIAGVPVKNEEEEADEERFEVWEENWITSQVFRAMSTQWERVALPDGEVIRTRLIYEALPAVRDGMRGIRKKEWQEIFEGLRTMELAALKVMREERERNRNTSG